MSPRLSTRGAVEPFHVMEVIKAAAARQVTHGDVISLCAGQPSTPAPRAVREAAVAALGDQVLGYTEAVGTRALREAIAGHYHAAYRIDVDPDDVVVTTGSSGGFTALFLAAFDAGDTVAMSRPGYPAYRNTLQAMGCRVVELDCGPETRFQPSVAMLEEYAARAGAAPAGLIVASPSNPTGTIIDPAELAAIARWCDEHGTLLVSDEIYHGISYGRPCASAWETSRQAVLVGSLSKYWSMTGWRVGWLVLPRHLVRPVELLVGNLTICPPAVSQVAAVAAFGAAAQVELDGHVARYAANRDLLLSRLPGLGVGSLAPPDGAFYLWFDVRGLLRAGEDSQGWCRRVLGATGVALTPGVDFAPAVAGGDARLDGRDYVRLSFAGSTAEMGEA
ncbi:MAG TPA: aminotransferase class I/II-fold pyridoxal phosphate-dependent enzyme, partial [Dermatophilaceae bacterium]|nr:aminotransferase class I/II-fold pyridoxal phosphate-dependent enzyme [Dermatophilaceae bacterium]